MTYQPMRSGAGKFSAEPTPSHLSAWTGEVSPLILGPIQGYRRLRKRSWCGWARVYFLQIGHRQHLYSHRFER